MEWNEEGCTIMEYNGTEWNGTKRDAIFWNGLECNVMDLVFI